jgi:predicted permease
MRALLVRFADLFRKERHGRELAAELESHLQMHVDDNLRAGMGPEEARRRALIKLGGLEQTKEQYRDRRGFQALEMLIQDVRFGLRMLGKNPGFTAVAVLTLALGIGANTVMFSVLEGVVLAPLPYSEADRLVVVWQSNPRFPQVAISYPNFRDWQRNARSFQQMAAVAAQQFDLTSPGTPEHIDGAGISSGFFSALGVKLELGRDFTPNEDQWGGAPVVIISNRLWRNRFNGSPEALGKIVTLNGQDYTVVGIVPPRFHFEGEGLGTGAELYTALGQGRGTPVELNNRSGHWIVCIARLKPGLSVPQAQAEMSTLQNSLDQLYPNDDRDLGTDVVPLKQQVIGDASGSVLLLLGAVGLVLLIACSNVANLLLARSTVRSREFAVRSALGASRSRIARQLLTESVLLSLSGASLGVLLVKWGLALVLAAVPQDLPRTENIGLNLPVLLFALGVSIAVAILFGLTPALKGSRSDLQTSLKGGAQGSASNQSRAQSTLVIMQLALTLPLLVGAGLLLRTIRHLWTVNPGFDSQHTITFKVGGAGALKTASSTRIAYQQLIERIRKIPGVEAAEFTNQLPLTPQSWGTMPFWIGSQRPLSVQGAPRLIGFLTGPDYLRTMGIPLLRGRFFTPQDTTKSPCVVVIDSVFAQMYFQGSDPIGQTLSFGFVPVGPCQIVGVVGHVRARELSDSTTHVRNQVYFPFLQDPDVWVPINFPDATLMVRTPLDAATIMPAIKATVYEAGSEQPVYNVHTMQDIVSESMSSQRFPMILLVTFAGLALLLASVGIYGLISYSVAQRVHEIGIRMALGAERVEIFRMVIGQGLRLVVAGLSIGAAAALIMTRLLSSFSRLLYGVGANDPVTFAVVSLALIVMAISACYIPALRATKIDPMVALRYE